MAVGEGNVNCDCVVPTKLSIVSPVTVVIVGGERGIINEPVKFLSEYLFRL